MNWTIINVGDTRETISKLDSDSVQTIITSPPYFGLRDYQVEGQVGLEATPQEYVASLVAIFRECRRVLRPDGTLWLNIGDSYARDARKGQHKAGDPGKQSYVYERGGGRASSTLHLVSESKGSFDGGVGRADRAPIRNSGEGLKPKDLIGIPWLLAFALRNDGWYLRSDIIWHKPNPLPESVRDRPTNAHEHIFLLAKSEKYYYDFESVREAAQNHRKPGRNIKETGHYGAGNGGNTGLTGFIQKYHSEGLPEYRNRRNVWSIDEDEFEQFLAWKARNSDGITDVWRVTTKPFKGAHFATFPPDLIEPCIKAGSAIDGIVLDPFAGSGTTALVANKLKRNTILLELNSDYAQMAFNRLIDNGIDPATISLC